MAAVAVFRHVLAATVKRALGRCRPFSISGSCDCLAEDGRLRRPPAGLAPKQPFIRTLLHERRATAVSAVGFPSPLPHAGEK